MDQDTKPGHSRGDHVATSRAEAERAGRQGNETELVLAPGMEASSYLAPTRSPTKAQPRPTPALPVQFSEWLPNRHHTGETAPTSKWPAAQARRPCRRPCIFFN